MASDPRGARPWLVLGLGLVFLGLALMKSAFDPVRGNQEFQGLFLAVGDNPLLGVLAGAVVTVILQSSSATIGLTMAMATSGLLSFEAGVALILGENIGTTATANLAALGANLAARRTALAHFLFNAIGVCYMLLLFPLGALVTGAVLRALRRCVRFRNTPVSQMLRGLTHPVWGCHTD